MGFVHATCYSMKQYATGITVVSISLDESMPALKLKGPKTGGGLC